MRKRSLTLVCRLSMSLTTKTLEHVVLAYNLPRGPAVDQGKVAEAAQKTAQAEAPHAALAAQPSTEAASDLMPDRRFPPRGLPSCSRTTTSCATRGSNSLT